MDYGQAMLAFTGVALLLTITPGLDMALVLRSALTQGRAHAAVTGLGICTGSLLWGLAAAVGIAALIAASDLAYTALKVVGAAYLIWLGVSLIRPTLGRSPREPDPVTDMLELIPEDPDEQAALRASVEDRAAREEAAHRQPAEDRVAQDDAAQDGAGHDPEDRAAGHTPTPLRPERLSRGFMRGFTTNMLNPKVGVFYLAMIPQFMAVGVPAWLMGLSLAGIHVAMTLVFFALLISAAHAFRRLLAGPRAAAWIDRVTGTALLVFGVVLLVDGSH